MVALHDAELPQSSRATQVRINVYSWSHDPGMESVVKVTSTRPSQPSVTVGASKTGTEPHSIGLISSAHMITGAVLSCTSMVALHDAELPQSSRATQVRINVYSWSHDPGMESVVKVTSTRPSQPSVTVGASKTGNEPHSIGLTTSAHVIIGSVLSCTSMVALHDAELPQSSIATHVRINVYSWSHDPGMESVVKVSSEERREGS